MTRRTPGAQQLFSARNGIECEPFGAYSAQQKAQPTTNCAPVKPDASEGNFGNRPN